jgi:isoquinoline 1-oxidoreductase alpha subunit
MSEQSNPPLMLTINGEAVPVNVAPDTPLLWALRHDVGATGTRFGCGMALCGACTVHVNGEPVRSCSTPVSTVVGKSITTIEGLTGPVADALRSAWTTVDVAQCGYCQSGQIMSAAALLAATPSPTDADIDTAMDGNVCRCGTYPRIRAAIRAAAAQLSNARSGT